MRLLLTGSTGFIGSHVLNLSLSLGHPVCAIRRSNSSKPKIQLSREPTWLIRELDEVTQDDLKGFDVLIHLAAHSVALPYDSLLNCLRWNLTSVIHLFEQARLAGIRRFIVAGSCFEYGRSGDIYDEIPTLAPLDPTNSYAASKAAASLALTQWAKEHQLSLDILRVFHVFGEGESETRLWPLLRKKALSGENLMMTEGQQVRDFISVEDVSSIFIQRACLSFSDSPSGETYNLSSGNVCRVRSFAEHWWNIWGAKGELLFGKLPYRSDEVMSYVAGHNRIIVTPSTHHLTPAPLSS